MRGVLESVWSQSSRRRIFSASREHYKRVGSCWCSVSARNASSSAGGECTDTGEAPGGGEVPSKGETRKASGKKVVKKGKTKAKAASSSTAAAGQEQDVSSKRSRPGDDTVAIETAELEADLEMMGATLEGAKMSTMREAVGKGKVETTPIAVLKGKREISPITFQMGSKLDAEAIRQKKPGL